MPVNSMKMKREGNILMPHSIKDRVIINLLGLVVAISILSSESVWAFHTGDPEQIGQRLASSGSASTSQIRDFCDASNYAAVRDLLNEERERDGKSRVRVESVMNGTDDPWILSFFPRRRWRLASFQSDFYLGRSIDQVRQILNSSWTLSESDERALKKSRQQRGAVIGNLVNNRVFRRLACNQIAPTASQCQRGLGRIANITKQKGGVILFSEIKSVMLDESYYEGVRLYALKVFDWVMGNSTPPSNAHYFTDLIAAFEEAGVPRAEAIQKAWEITGVLAARGPNFGKYADAYGGQDVAMNIKVGLDTIAKALPFLDMKTRGQGRLYSMPSRVSSTCDNGKSYHFWMSAYLTQRLIEEGIDFESASAAVYTAQRGYQFISTTGSRNPPRALYTPTFDGFNNIMRADLTYSIAGAHYAGMVYGRRPNEVLNYNEALHTTLRAAADIGDYSVEQAESMYRATSLPTTLGIWEQRFSSQAPYDYFKSH